MLKSFTAFLALFLLCISSNAIAQTPDFPKPTKEHQWLKQFQGEWETHAQMIAHGETPAMECESSMKFHSLGDFWVTLETTGQMGGVKVHSIQTLGYDPEKKKYIGTWVDSATPYMFHYEGYVEKSGKRLVLEAEGPSYIEPGKRAKYRDSYEFKTPDLIVGTSAIMDDDGNWVTFVTSETIRKQDLPRE